MSKEINEKVLIVIFKYAHYCINLSVNFDLRGNYLKVGNAKRT